MSLDHRWHWKRIFLRTIFPSIYTIMLCIQPYFDVSSVNVTVVAGGAAVLPCSIEDIGKYKVAWMSPKFTVLTLMFKRIIADRRFSLEQPYPKEWNLHIRNVRLSDQGKYRCTLNTKPPEIKIVSLLIHEPAKIIKKWSTGDVVLAQEGDTISLICNATGVPHPEITWYRIPTDSVDQKQRIGMAGEILVIRNVSRDCDDTYECVAYNGINPADSNKIKVSVEFAPEVRLFTKRIGQSRNKDTIIECEVTANPQHSTFWKRNGQTVVNNYKYKVDIFLQEETTVLLTLTIRDLEKEDYGKYTCVSSNQFGESRGTVLVYELKDRTRSTPSTTLTSTSSTPTRTKHRKTKPHRVTTRPTYRPTTPRARGEYTPGNIKGTAMVNIVTETGHHGAKKGQSSQNESQGNNMGSKSTYAGIFLIVFISAMSSICACRRS